MASITLGGNPVNTAGELPAVGSKAPNFKLTNTKLEDVSLSDLAGSRVVLNIFPSIDTGVCATSTRKFNAQVQELSNTKVLCVSKDLPMAHARFCGAEGLENVHGMSQFRDTSFSDAYKVDMVSGGMSGFMSRAIVVLDTDGTVLHTEQVSEIAQEPNYSDVKSALA